MSRKNNKGSQKQAAAAAGAASGASTSGTTSANDAISLEKKYASANKEFRKGNYSECVKALSEIEAVHPHNSKVFLYQI